VAALLTVNANDQNYALCISGLDTGTTLASDFERYSGWRNEVDQRIIDLKAN
jgi:hypothetical protein